MFNALNMDDLLARGLCVELPIESRASVNSQYPTAAGARFHRVEYRTFNGLLVARAHFKRNPDGQIADSGLPDPDDVYVGGRAFRFSQWMEDGQPTTICKPFTSSRR